MCIYTVFINMYMHIYCTYRSVLKALNWVPADLVPVTEKIAGQEAGQGVTTVVYNGRKMVDNTGGVLHQYGIR